MDQVSSVCGEQCDIKRERESESVYLKVRESVSELERMKPCGKRLDSPEIEEERFWKLERAYNKW